MLVNDDAAFCAAENTLEKKLDWFCGFGVVPPFSESSGVGVRGADTILLSLLGPKFADPDLTRRCDIMFPLGDVTIPESGGDTGGADIVR